MQKKMTMLLLVKINYVRVSWALTNKMNDIWYYAEGDKPVGPLSLTDMIAFLSRVSNAKKFLFGETVFQAG